MQLKVSFRNVFRNKRRTALSIGMIAGGFSAMILFYGFVNRMMNELQWVAINSQYGHLQIASEKYWERSGEVPRDSLVKKGDAVMKLLRGHPEVTNVAGRISFPALISSGEYSTTAMGLSFDIEAEPKRAQGFQIISGSSLSPDRPFQIMVGHLLAKRLRVKPGDTINILGYTYDNVINALELEISGLFATGVNEVDDTSFAVPLSTAQKLLDTDQVEIIVVGLRADELVDSTRESLRRELTALDPELKVQRWLDLAKLYREVLDYYKVQNRFVELIITSLVLLGILNVIGMAIYERTGEIGTIRALGFTRAQVMGQFLLEGIILGVFGVIAGIALSFLLTWIVNWLKIPLTVPGASTVLLIRVDLSFKAYQMATALIVVTSIIAAAIPSFRASKIPIVDALKHNI